MKYKIVAIHRVCSAFQSCARYTNSGSKGRRNKQSRREVAEAEKGVSRGRGTGLSVGRRINTNITSGRMRVNMLIIQFHNNMYT